MVEKNILKDVELPAGLELINSYEWQAAGDGGKLVLMKEALSSLIEMNCGKAKQSEKLEELVDRVTRVLELQIIN